MLRCICFLIIACVASAPIHSRSAEPERLIPSGPWVLDYHADKCRIVRSFTNAEGKKETVLYFEQQAPSSSLAWMVAGSAVPPRRSVKLKFGEKHEPIETNGKDLTFGKYRNAVTGVGFAPPISAAELAAAQAEREAGSTALIGLPSLVVAEADENLWIDVSAPAARVYRIQVGDMRPVYAAMNKCMEDLVTEWGLDLVAQRQVARAPVWSNIDDVVNKIQAYYPSRALKEGDQALMQIRVMIDQAGKPENCEMTDITSAENFYEKACQQIMNHARFEPARSLAGDPLPSYYITLIRYAAPR